MFLGDIKTVKNPKVAVFSCPFDMLNTETKGTVLIKNAKELKNFSTGEEDLIEAVCENIALALFINLAYCMYKLYFLFL